MKFLLEIKLPEHQAVEDELEKALAVEVARYDFEAAIREWLWDFLTTDVPCHAIVVTLAGDR